MTCRDVLDFLADYLDGKLPLRQKITFGLHLCLCRNCRIYLETYRKTIKAARSAEIENVVTEELPEDLIQAILAARSHGPHVD